MKKRPLCFMCAALVLLNFLIMTSGGQDRSPDDLSFLKTYDSEITVYGEVYQCDNTKEQQILYLKQTILSETFPKSNENNKIWKKVQRLRVTCKKGEALYQIGDKLCLYGTARSIEPSTNPGQFDRQAYYAGKKIGFTMWEPRIQLLERPNVHLNRFLYDIRTELSGVMERCVVEENPFARYLPSGYLKEISNILRGIVLGDKGDLSQDVKRMYQKAGISHILAISAMHLTILGNGFFGILKKTGMPIRSSYISTGIFLTLYGILTGAGIATLRALIMFLLNAGAQMTGRTYDGKTGLSVAAVLLLSGNPLAVTDSGFLLSFTAMLSFALFQEKRKIGSSVLLYLFMLPVVLWIFYEVPLYSILVNLLIVPSLSIVLLSGTAACLLGMVFPLAGGIAGVPAGALLAAYGWICHLIRDLPGAVLIPGRPSPAGILLYYGIMMAALYLFRKNRLSWKRFFVFLLMVPAVCALIYQPGNKLTVTALDIGQGDCVVIETPKQRGYMVDGGSSTVKDIGQYRIWPFLKHQGLPKLELIFITHTDQDHTSGIIELLENIISHEIELEIGGIVLPKWEDMTPFEEICHLAHKAEIPVTVMKRGDVYRDGEVTFTCLHPNGLDYKENPNEGSLVLKVTYGAFDGLFMGDLEGAGEQEVVEWMEKHMERDEVEYLKVAHHGSGNSTCEKFLSLVRPRMGIISCGENNFYGHPHKELLDRLEAWGTDAYATKDYGAIWIGTDGQKIDLHTFCKYNKEE